MNYIVFASCIHVDVLSQKGTEQFLEEVTDFYCMSFADKGDVFNLALKKVERYGSFSYLDETKYKKIRAYSDE